MTGIVRAYSKGGGSCGPEQCSTTGIMAQQPRHGAMTAMSWYHSLSEAEVARLLEVGLGYLRRHVSKPDDVEDLGSKLHLKILLKQESIAGVVRPARNSYIRKMALRLLLDHNRSRRPDSPLTEHEKVADDQAYERWEQAVEWKLVEQVGPIVEEYASRSPEHQEKAWVWHERADNERTFRSIADDVDKKGPAGRWTVSRWFREVSDHIRRELERLTPPDDDADEGEGWT